MGFFSQDCEGCGHPALSPMATEDKNGWMSQVVVVTKNDSILRGEYDGYGRVGTWGDDSPVIGSDNTVWHQACWEVADKPTDYRGASTDSADQGWFFDGDVHNLPDPRLKGTP